MQMKVCVSLFSSDVQFRCWRKGAPFWLESITRLFGVLISIVLSPAASASFLYCVFVLFCCKMYHGFPPVHFFFLQKKYNLSFFLNIPRRSSTGPLLTLCSLSLLQPVAAGSTNLPLRIFSVLVVQPTVSLTEKDHRGVNVKTGTTELLLTHHTSHAQVSSSHRKNGLDLLAVHW